MTKRSKFSIHEGTSLKKLKIGIGSKKSKEMMER